MVFSYPSRHTDLFLTRLLFEPAVLVQVASTRGSVPREAGTWMAVFADALVGTIGGGHLEYQAIANARAQLPSASATGGPVTLRFALGPALG
ncbi:MAG: xanthine dehydrogenase accessory protein XdhC, partial [Polaromonas sp.]|nr:xanthine dehydrogenase accessory protein XdhC [Polaromonas sp.]